MFGIGSSGSSGGGNDESSGGGERRSSDTAGNPSSTDTAGGGGGGGGGGGHGSGSGSGGSGGAGTGRNVDSASAARAATSSRERRRDDDLDPASSSTSSLPAGLRSEPESGSASASAQSHPPRPSIGTRQSQSKAPPQPNPRPHPHQHPHPHPHSHSHQQQAPSGSASVLSSSSLPSREPLPSRPRVETEPQSTSSSSSSLAPGHREAQQQTQAQGRSSPQSTTASTHSTTSNADSSRNAPDTASSGNTRRHRQGSSRASTFLRNTLRLSTGNTDNDNNNSGANRSSNRNSGSNRRSGSSSRSSTSGGGSSSSSSSGGVGIGNRNAPLPSRNISGEMAATHLQRLGRSDPALLIPHGSLNNSAGESVPSIHSSFTVGVAEDKNRTCRRTMEDAHSFIYNYLGVPRTPAHLNPTAGFRFEPPSRESTSIASKLTAKFSSKHGKKNSHDSNNNDDNHERIDPAMKPTPTPNLNVAETDNGFFAVYDGHAGSVSADWCGKKVHLLVEDSIRSHPHQSVAELLDAAFQEADRQMDADSTLRNSGCTAVVAVMRWEDRIPPPNLSPRFKDRGDDPKYKASPMTNIEQGAGGDGGHVDIAAAGMETQTNVAAEKALDENYDENEHKKRVRMLYVANVGDSRAVLCRNGKAVRLTYDHKGADEHEGRRIARSGGMIFNYRVNGVLAVTRALGDCYMKDIVTGHPFTTETMIDPDTDDFLIIACDGLWDVCTDQEAVDHVRNITDSQVAAQALVNLSLEQFSSDNLSCMVIRFDKAKMRAVMGHAVIPAGLTEMAPTQEDNQKRSSDTAETKVTEGSGESAHPPTEDTSTAADAGDQKDAPSALGEIVPDDHLSP